jgi:hypothetical protein
MKHTYVVLILSVDEDEYFFCLVYVSILFY